MPTQPRTPVQQANRARMSANSALWRTLTSEQRQAWKGYALNHPVVNSLGQTVVLSGHMMFNAINVRMNNIGLLSVSVPPNEEDPVSTPSVSSVDQSVGSVEFEIAASDPGCYVVFYFSPARSQGVSFNGDYRYIAAQATDDINPTNVNLGPTLAAKYGTQVVGQKYFYRIVYCNAVGAWAVGDYGTIIIT